VPVYTIVYIRVCVRCELVRACVYVCVCVCVRVRVGAYAYEGIEGALLLGVFPPQERASPPAAYA